MSSLSSESLYKTTPSTHTSHTISYLFLHFSDFTKHILLSMSNLRRVLERQQKEREEIRRRRAEEDRDADEEEE